MKCGKLLCWNEAKPRQKYCSKGCAPYANLPGGDGHSTALELERLRRYGLAARGEALVQSNIEEPLPKLGTKKEKPILSSTKNAEPKRKIDTGETTMQVEQNKETVGTVSHLNKSLPNTKPVWSEEQIDRLREKYGETGMPVIDKTTAEKKLNAEKGATRPTASTPQSKPFAEEKSDSLNLINDSAKHLFDLMKSLEKNSSKDVQAACNCAGTIQKLIRLKIDIVKIKE